MSFGIIVDLVYMHAILNSLERLLSEAEDADTFIGISEKGKRLVLNDLLGDASTDVVDAESIKQVTVFVTCVEYWSFS